MAFVDRLKSPNKTRRIRELLTKISALETNIFSLKMMMKSGYFKIPPAPARLIQPFRADCFSLRSCNSEWASGASN